MEKIKDLLLGLENKYTHSIPLIQILENKYSFVMDGDEKEKYQAEKLEESKFILSNDAEVNGQFMNQLIESVDNLTEMLHLSEEDAMPAKIFDDYKSQLGKISEKKLASGEKLADSLCKCIKRTILKLLNIKNYGTEIMNYLRANGFRLDSFEKGHKLSDDDLCFLDENLLQAYKEKTENSHNNYQVIDMVQPIIRIFYIDEDDEEVYSHFLPGICKYFVKEVGK